MNVLVVDIGGTNVKVLAAGQDEPRKFPSGSRLTPTQMIAGVRELAEDWTYNAIAIGYPGLVINGQPAIEPHNLGPGWIGFDFAGEFGRPTRIVNDAAMQALGSYRRGKMLFLGLGTGLGAALIARNKLEPLELAHLPYKKGTFEDYVGLRGLETFGKKKWRHHVKDVVERLTVAFEPDEVVLGGGNVHKLKDLPPGCRAGDNRHAFIGGFRLWHPKHKTGGPGKARSFRE